MAQNPFQYGIFSRPKFSAFSWNHGNRISMDAGKIHVIGSEYLDTGEKFDLKSLGNVTRVAPMKAPTLDTYQTDVFAFACRLRSLGMANRNPWPYEDFFNLRENLNNAKTLPSIPLAVLFGVNRFRNNTLLENFGLPTFKNLKEQYRQFLMSYVPYVFDTSVTFNFEGGSWQVLPSTFDMSVDGPFSFNFQNKNYFLPESDENRYRRPYNYSFISWVFNFSRFSDSLLNYFFPSFESIGGITLHRAYLVSDSAPHSRFQGVNNATNILDVIYDIFKIDSISVFEEYLDFLYDGLWELRTYDYDAGLPERGFCYVFGIYPDSIGSEIIRRLHDNFPDLPTLNLSMDDTTLVSCPMVPTYFYDGYFKIVADWFINTSIADPDSWYLNAVKLFHPRSSNGEEYNWTSIFNVVGSQTAPNEYKTIISNWHLTEGFCYRYWRNDYFTSCFPSPQAGDSVAIPQGSIIDLRNANSWQKLKERLAYAGHRWRDVLFAITGKRTSSAIMDMSEVLGAWSNTINVDSVLQQSETTNSQPLANYAGTGLGYRSGGKGAYYVAEEPTAIIIVACVRPRASYFQGLHRKFTRSYLMDFDIPQLSNVGEDVVRVSELYFDGDSITDKTEAQTRFGYQRRYGSFMWTPDEVHGDFRGSLDYWHNARIFGSEPSLSTNFLQVRPDEDNLNRVFAVTSDSVNHFYAHFTFIGDVIRHLPKAAIYDL